MPRIRSTPKISAIPVSGTSAWRRTKAKVIIPAPGTPAAATDASVASSLRYAPIEFAQPKVRQQLYHQSVGAEGMKQKYHHDPVDGPDGGAAQCFQRLDQADTQPPAGEIGTYTYRRARDGTDGDFGVQL